MKTKLILILLTVNIFCFAQDGKQTITKSFDMLNENASASYFEVTKSMFQMLSETKNTSPEFKEYVSKLHELKLIQSGGENRREQGIKFYKLFMAETNLNGYSRLMTKKEGNGQLSFYKKESKNENEFLLVSTEMIIYITGAIDLKSIGEFEQVMEIAGSAFEM